MSNISLLSFFLLGLHKFSRYKTDDTKPFLKYDFLARLLNIAGHSAPDLRHLARAALDRRDTQWNSLLQALLLSGSNDLSTFIPE